ncbi:hypothetical protein [Halarchaeum nitratireducens]|nr:MULTISPECIES: hypothetical protein [Halarchaeum]MBP2251382.1 hypothetical protein [Halarchaeum solikamskense]
MDIRGRVIVGVVLALALVVVAVGGAALFGGTGRLSEVRTRVPRHPSRR